MTPEQQAFFNQLAYLHLQGALGKDLVHPVKTHVLNELKRCTAGRAGGHELSLLEVAGRAGDVYLMDVRLIHTPSINASKDVRLMATMRCYASQGGPG